MLLYFTYANSHLPIPEGHNVRVVGGADDLLVESVGRLAPGGLHAEGVPALLVRDGEELPGCPQVAVHRALQHPVARPRGGATL